MNTKTILALIALGSLLLVAQQVDISGIITKGDLPAMAVIDFRGSGDAQRNMNTFNQVLFSELQGAGLFKMVAKSFYPLRVPQQPADFRPGGAQLSEWSAPPVNANYLAFGYTAVQNGQLVLFGYLYNVKLPEGANPQVIGKLYNGSVDDAGAKKVAEEFAADILKQFGGTSLMGSKIYFVSDRTGHKEIWSMDYDGSNQKQLTHWNNTTVEPAVSPDGAKLAYLTWAKGNPRVMIQSLETGRMLPFVNPNASVNSSPAFAPDGRRLVFASSLAGGFTQIYIADSDGGNLNRISYARAVEVEPKVNPATGAEIVFSSGRSGTEQVYRMSLDGADPVRLTTGEGDASNPAWRPDGKVIAFAWTRGYDPGGFNIFIMDVATRKYVQLTQGMGRNENPNWAPDGLHIVYSSKRGRQTQIYTMLVDGSQPQQLTTQGNNTQPVWGKGSF